MLCEVMELRSEPLITERQSPTLCCTVRCHSHRWWNLNKTYNLSSFTSHDGARL